MGSEPALPTIDVVVPVHTAERPIRRAVASVVSANGTQVRAIVVCHNIAPSVIRRSLSGLDEKRFSLIEHRDEFPSAAGPLNAGVRAATADYVTVLGSDDEYEPGVFDAWSTELSERPELLFGQFKMQLAGRILAPAPRVFRFSRLDAVRDLLYDRTPQLAVLIRRDQFSRPGYPGFTEGVRNGEDIAAGIFLPSFASSIVYSRFAEGFFGWEDGDDRVTSAPAPLGELLRPVRDVLSHAWVDRLSQRQRTAMAIKLARNHVLSFYRERSDAIGVTRDDLEALRSALLELDALSPGYRRRMTREDFAISELLLSGEAVPGSLPRRRAPLISRLLPQDLRFLFAPEGMLVRAIRIAVIPRTLRSTGPRIGVSP